MHSREDRLQLPVGLAKALSRPLLSGVAGREREACTAVSILTLSCVGELGADILVTSACLSRTASSCRRSAGKKQRPADKPKKFLQMYSKAVVKLMKERARMASAVIDRVAHYYNLVNSHLWLHPLIAAQTPAETPSHPARSPGMRSSRWPGSDAAQSSPEKQ